MSYTSIIAGSFKGTRLKTGNRSQIRPTQSWVRKGIFDTLPDLSGVTVLDLFAGVGTLGFEAISRGASSVTFVDKSIRSINILKDNCRHFNGSNIKIIREDVLSFLKKKSNLPYDLIFADPPYNKVDLDCLYSSVFKLLTIGSTLVIEYSVYEKWNSENSITTKKYGDTLISYFYKRS